jgi:hypothetical protein
VKLKRAGCYAESFDAQSHDLPALPAFGEYRGFLFGSLDANVPPLKHIWAKRPSCWIWWPIKARMASNWCPAR